MEALAHITPSKASKDGIVSHWDQGYVDKRRNLYLEFCTGDEKQTGLHQPCRVRLRTHGGLSLRLRQTGCQQLHEIWHEMPYYRGWSVYSKNPETSVIYPKIVYFLTSLNDPLPRCMCHGLDSVSVRMGHHTQRRNRHHA